MDQYLPQQGVVVVPMMSRQSQDVRLASAADAGLGSVLRQYHLEQLQFPISTTNDTANKTKQLCGITEMISIILHLHTNVA